MARAALALVLAACSGAADDGVDARPPPGEHLPGSVSISQYLSPDRTSILASFQDGRDQCAETAVNGCTFTSCGIDSLASAFDAGTITVAGTSVRALAPIRTSTSQITYRYGSNVHDFVDGEPLTISTTGATVPKFSATLSMPTRASVARPSSLVIDRSQPFTFTWTGGDGDVVIYWSFWGTQSINCHFPASAGSATVPADVMAMLVADKGYLTFVTRSDVRVTAGPWDVQVSALQHAAWPDGSVADTSVTFQ